MRLVLPLPEKQTFQLTWENQKVELRLSPFHNYIDLASLSIKPDTLFTLNCNYIPLFQTSINILSYLEQNMLINRACLCLDIFNKGESIYPVHPTTTFYNDDAQIAFWMEFIPVKHPVPLFISCWYGNQPKVTINGYIPALKKNLSYRALTSYATGFFIGGDLPAGEWLLKANLPTGKTLFTSRFKLLNIPRPDYGENTSLFPIPDKGGKIINELVE